MSSPPLVEHSEQPYRRRSVECPTWVCPVAVRLELSCRHDLTEQVCVGRYVHIFEGTENFQMIV
jgi:hypothetical protein